MPLLTFFEPTTMMPTLLRTSWAAGARFVLTSRLPAYLSCRNTRRIFDCIRGPYAIYDGQLPGSPLHCCIMSSRSNSTSHRPTTPLTQRTPFGVVEELRGQTETLYKTKEVLSERHDALVFVYRARYVAPKCQQFTKLDR